MAEKQGKEGSGQHTDDSRESNQQRSMSLGKIK